MRKNFKNILKITLFVDFLITCGFGLISWLYPNETFGTIINIPENENAVFYALLANHSISYMLIGLVCLIGVKSNHPINSWIGMIMLFRHLVINILGIMNMDKEWIIGNPYHDIVIHTLFVVVYIIGIIISIGPKYSSRI